MDAYTDYYVRDDNQNLQKVSLDNYAGAVKVSNKRNQLLLTLAYKF